MIEIHYMTQMLLRRNNPPELAVRCSIAKFTDEHPLLLRDPFVEIEQDAAAT